MVRNGEKAFKQGGCYSYNNQYMYGLGIQIKEMQTIKETQAQKIFQIDEYYIWSKNGKMRVFFNDKTIVGGLYEFESQKKENGLS